MKGSYVFYSISLMDEHEGRKENVVKTLKNHRGFNNISRRGVVL